MRPPQLSGIKLPFLLLPAVCIAAGVLLWDRYTFEVRWPSRVQEEVLGATIASREMMISKERSFSYGEGFARWRYKLDDRGSALRHLCQGASAGRCSFTRTRKVVEGVDVSVELAAGVLVVEEWWS